MSIEQFSVEPATPSAISTVIVALIGIGVILLVINLLLRNRLHDHSDGDREGSSRGGIGKYLLAIIGIGLIIFGGFVYFVASASASPSVVTIGDGYINVDCKDFVSYGALTGTNANKNVTSEEIADAFVGQVGSGDFTLHKQYGTDFGDTNTGNFTLGNGAIAYVATTNATTLIIELKTGEYLIVGTPDTQALADSFAQNVHPLTPKK